MKLDVKKWSDIQEYLPIVVQSIDKHAWNRILEEM